MTRNRWSLKVGTTSGQQWRQPSLHPALALRLLILPQSLFPLFLLWFILSLFACLCLLVCSSLSYSLFIFSIFIIRSFSFSLPFHFFTHSLANPFFTSFSSISVHSSFCEAPLIHTFPLHCFQKTRNTLQAKTCHQHEIHPRPENRKSKFEIHSALADSRKQMSR